MKRCILIPVILLSLSCFSQAQTKTTNTQVPPVQVFMNYIIRLNTFAEGQYGYAVLYQGKPVIDQKLNPFTLSPKGLSNREDVFKVARWQIQQLAAGASPELFASHPLSPALAKPLDIRLN